MLPRRACQAGQTWVPGNGLCWLCVRTVQQQMQQQHHTLQGILSVSRQVIFQMAPGGCPWILSSQLSHSRPSLELATLHLKPQVGQPGELLTRRLPADLCAPDDRSPSTFLILSSSLLWLCWEDASGTKLLELTPLPQYRIPLVSC